MPCMISFTRQSPSFLITYPKYDNFLLFVMLISPRSIPAVSNTHSFVFFCVHNTLRILHMHFISKASILCSSHFLMFQLSHTYVATGHTKAFMSLTLVVNFMP